MGARKSVESDYYITPCGKVWSYRYNKFLTPFLNNWGYLCINYMGKTHLLHRLVAEKWIPNPNNYPMVNHIDENKLNSKISNLEWCNAKYNNNFGKMKTRENIKIKVYCNETATEYESISDCERKLGIFNISAVLKGKFKQMNGYTFKSR